MTEAFKVSEILQRTRTDDVRPGMVFDIARWADARMAGSVFSRILDVQADGTTFGSFTIPRSGLYRVFASVSTGVSATRRAVRLVYFNIATGEAVWDHNVMLISGGISHFGPMDLYLRLGDRLSWQLNGSAMVLGDDMSGSIQNWELVV